MFVKCLAAGLLLCYVSATYAAVLKVEDGVGKLKALSDGFHSRITNGEDAEPGQFPHQVSLSWGLPPNIPPKHSCGGALIAPGWVLTAGHCIKVPAYGKITVLAGKHLIDEKEDTQQSSEVSKSIVHESYEGGVNPNDIALLKLTTPFTLNDRVQLVKLPVPNSVPSGTVVLSGWGSVSTTINTDMPNALQTATLTIVDYASCEAFLNNLLGTTPIDKKSNICSGPLGTDTAACSGDSGGPLIQYNSKGKAEVIGIVSWGLYPCGNSGAPSVYTRVSNFVDWINKTIKNN